MTAARQPVKPVRLRGRSFLALVLSPELPFSDWLASLDDLAARSTGFFLGRPIVLDVDGLNNDGLGFTAQELSDLVAALASRGVRIMGIEGAAPSQLGPGMPPAMRGGREAGEIQPEAAPVAAAPGQAPAPSAAPAAAAPLPALVQAAQKSSLVIDAPVRSGQSIIFPEGDVTILGSIASGAEVIAGGSIHVYGSLRGRALAGSAGQTDARIFCRKLEAELIAIDGLYKTAEDIEPKLHGQSVQIWLDGDRLKTVALA
ncbi:MULTISPECIES: septum site-determining protein MinC [unclassified Aureimonas]|uniref:septum site-determining protein MinC n=1 Tax=unclassified Aureimonas TaxID=2615206 RepID=UPI0006FDA974|nr:MULTISPECIES: septum site-determining protein MinC [unclassified Aureimonas]KQT60665.1 septum formation inhibitor [Aureimonas sp. Leaf460]KQT68794.1 septum formation inhibitor [Aureimonas sp. Leaf427]